MDKAKLVEAKRRNGIIQKCKEWENNGIKISLEDFYDIHTTFRLQEDILAKLDEVDLQKKSIICRHEDAIVMFTNYASKLISKSIEYVFFEANSTELGALKLQGNIISNNLGYVISKSEFFDDGCSIFICTEGLENGVCLWRGEYDSRIYCW